MKRITILVGALALCALASPGGAHAATLTYDGATDTLTYAAAAAQTNLVGFNQPTADPDVELHRFDGDSDPIAALPANCTEEDPGTRYLCTDVALVVADAGDEDDILDAGGAAGDFLMPPPDPTVLDDIEVEFSLGDGSDLSAGGRSDDTITAGDGDDLMALDPIGGGGGGSDTADAGAGNDDVLSGRGDDEVQLGDGDDHVGGGPGIDTLEGGAGDDDIASGPGADILRGDAGNDTLTGECDEQPCPPEPGAGAGDDVDGGPGLDLFRYETYAPGPVTITLDDAANDGAAGEGDNIDDDVEDVRVTGPGDATVTGAPGFNNLTTGSGTDTINSRDGSPDRVSCGAGTDVVNADDVDVIGPDCETVNVVTSGYNEDKAPLVAWSTPASGSRLSNTSANALAATASDDKGIASVQFLDDERTLCSDTTAPYTCDYRPQGDDVGRNTLVAVAIDGSGQTASAVRAVVVPRFAGTLSARTTPRRDARAPYRFTTTGRLTLPSGVTPAQGCRGTITVQFKAGRKTVSTRRVRLRSNCTYRSRVTFRIQQRLRPRTLRRSVRFGGNAVMRAKSARRQTLRVR